MLKFYEEVCKKKLGFFVTIVGDNLMCVEDDKSDVEKVAKKCNVDYKINFIKHNDLDDIISKISHKERIVLNNADLFVNIMWREYCEN